MQEGTYIANSENSNSNKLTSHTPAPNVPNVPVVHTRVPMSVGQAFTYQATRGGPSGAKNLRGAHPVNAMPVNPPHGGGPRSLHPVYTPMANKPDIRRPSLADFHAVQNSRHWQGHQGITGWPGWDPIMTQSLGACVFQSSLQAAIPLQRSPPKQDLSTLSAATAQPSQLASVLSFEDASSTNSSSVREEAGSKETVTCPFPKCNRKYGRFQELERHICERHLPPYLYCEQPGCDSTSSRPYLLKRHHVDKHPGVPMPEQDTFMIYDAKVLARQVRTKDIDIERVVYEACSLFEEKATQMGKLGIWRWMNGF